MRRPIRFPCAALLVALGVASGCAHRAPLTSVEPAGPALRDTKGAASVPATPAPVTREAADFSLRTIYFGYDSADLDATARATLADDAHRLRERAELRIVIEGHCDERGTEAYNIALGERRARSVRQFLVAAGVPERRLDVISYGKERPATEGRDERAWSLNRRAQMARAGH